MKKFTKRGFTLIELLVVIAVIGILSSIVLVSLSGARDRAKDARVVSSMDQVRSAAEIEFSEDDNYNDVDCANAPFLSLCADVNANAGANPTILVDSDGQGYCAVSPALPGSGQFHCVDGNLISDDYPAVP
ncbi:prepilin-type N-terminal cleavage/methylation domain-containing protein, partial [Candidatus Parcubacteria bacterium]|nr:prepilin-type N-terminal cleavage/methylation domain-containing protein [Candidatus Parcubacteria bacterium]